jgi:hypothetical protein
MENPLKFSIPPHSGIVSTEEYNKIMNIKDGKKANVWSYSPFHRLILHKMNEKLWTIRFVISFSYQKEEFFIRITF